jgi:branched-chain amino acid transport system ATP-binding protein
VEEGDRSATLLELDGLRRAFGSVVVADDLSLSIAPGETLGVVGPNGAGKTSVLNLITGALRADGGRILLDGVDITRHAAHERARLGIGRTYQVPQPFGGMTVFENALLGATYATGNRHDAGGRPAEAAFEALERTDLLDRANTLAGRLPLLDRKRLELARALATRPRLLLLDEIAGGLTEAEVGDLVVTIRRLRTEGVTIIWIEHIVHALVSAVDRLVAMSFGRKLAEGDPRVVLADPTVQAVYLGTQEASA